MKSDTFFNARPHEILASRHAGAEDSAPAPVSRPSRISRAVPADEAFNAVFDSSAEALVLLDHDGSIQRANSRARELAR